MKHETDIIQLLQEGKSYSYIQATLGVYPAQVAVAAMKVFGRRRSSSSKKTSASKEELKELENKRLESNEVMGIASEAEARKFFHEHGYAPPGWE